VAVLVFNIFQVISFSENIEVTADPPPPPDDNVNGTYTQYIEGDWVVNQTVSLSDEIIVLTGNLTIESGGSLTLKNVTLAMNSSSASGQKIINVNNGGSLIVTDGDNDPTTSHDFSNITDSPFDIDDDSGTDISYQLFVYPGAFFSINNSIIHECGYNNIKGLMILTNEKVIIENCTFIDKWGLSYESKGNITIKNCKFLWCKYSIYLRSGAENFNIINNDISYGEYGFYGLNVKNGYISGNEIYHCDRAIQVSGSNFVINNNLIHNNSAVRVMAPNQPAVELQITNSEFCNNIIKDNGNFNSSLFNCDGLKMFDCDNVRFNNNIIENTKNSSGIVFQSCSNMFYNNNSIIGNYKFGIYSIIQTDDTNIYFHNNNISDNNKLGIPGVSGLYIFDPSALENYVELKNNIIQGNDIGLYLFKLGHFSITDNTITNSSNAGVYARNVENGDFSNNSIQGDQYDIYVQDGAFEVTNCSFNHSNIYLDRPTASIIVKNFLNIYVSDINGYIPGIDIFANDSIGNNAFCGKTDGEGGLKYVRLTNKTITKTGISYHDPYNISAVLNGNISYGDHEPTMNKTNFVDIYFNIDLPPQSPSDLIAISNVTNVDLRWVPCYSPDLNHYLVYRRESQTPWTQVFNSSLLSLPERLWNNWTDAQAASDWSTYFYKVIAIDNIGQNSNFSNVDYCGDWAIADTKTHSDIAVALNGSILVYPTGNLTIRNVTILFNNSFKGEYGIEVMPGGELYVLDNDDDQMTTYDQSNITAIDIDYNLFFTVKDSKLVMRNSKLSNCGSNKDLTYSQWGWTDAIQVISKGEQWTRGLYVTGSGPNVTIENNNMTDNFISIFLDGTTGTNIAGNVFTDNIFGIYLNNSELNRIEGNSFDNNQGYPIFVFNSGNNTISSNNIKNPDNTINAGIFLYNQGCYGNIVINNTISQGDYGINLNQVGYYNIISHNSLSGQNTGIALFYSYGNTFLNNSYNDTENSGFFHSYSHHTIISGETLTFSNNGYYISSSDNVSISDTSIANIQNYGIRISFSKDILSNNVSMISCRFGIYTQKSNSLSFERISMEGPNSLTGMYCREDSQGIVFKYINIDESVEYAFHIDNGNNYEIYDSEIGASEEIFFLTYTSVKLYNTSYNQSKAELDSYSSISSYWRLNVLVHNWLDAPQDNANVQIRTGQGTLAYSGFTDIDGQTGEMWLCEQTQYSVLKEIFIPYQIQAVFSNHSGSTSFMLNSSSQTTVWLDNLLPSAANIVLSPSNPDTTMDLTLSYQYSDPEDDPENGTLIMWYVNGIYNSSFDDQLVIQNSITKKGQTWYCNVTPSDGSSYGISMLSTPISIQNTPPEVSNVVILESNPKSSDYLHIQYDYFDLDDDIEFQSLLRWYVDNGSGWIYSGVDSAVLDSSYTKKGEMWKCNITPSDGDDLGFSVESQEVLIGNSAPQVSDVYVSPLSPESNVTLWAVYDFYDLDSDTESGTLIRWYKNDALQDDLNDSISVDLSKTQSGDIWYFTIIPSDGQDFGTSEQSNSVSIGNTPPRISNVVISPQNPDTAGDLEVGYDYYDEDSDVESDDTNIKWYRMRPGDLEFSYTGYQGRILSSSFTTKGESWMCVVTPHDGQDYGGSENSTNFVSIFNSNPLVSDVFIGPEEATTKDDLLALYEYFDMDGDIESGSIILWYCNSVHMNALDGSTTVSNDLTEKGQIWNFSVQPSDGSDHGGVYSSNPITIGNSPPTASNLSITPDTPSGEQDLVAVYTFFDEDGDLESNTEIRWYKNGLLQTNYDGKFNVKSSDTKKGELWYFEIIVSDGDSSGEEMISHYVVIENSQPQISSQSPDQMQIVLNESETQEFSVDAQDPDGDILYYKWKLGKTTVSNDDFYLFETDYQSAGTYVLNLTVQDVGENSKVLYREWNIIVNNKNLIPEIVVVEPTSKNPKIKEGDSLRFIIDESDPDSETTPTITWYLDGEVAQSGGSSYTYVADDLASGNHEIKAVVNDSLDSTEYAWDLSVQDVIEEELMGLSYDAWGLILAILSGLGAVLLFLFGFYRVRKKKSRLREHMVEMDQIMAHEEDPGIIEDRLVDLEAKIDQEFAQGKLEDLHYHMLQDIIITRKGDVRKAEISSKFGRLPRKVVKDLDEMLKDGKISQVEYQGFVTTISKSESLSPNQKKELSRVIGEWEAEDKDGEEEEEKKKEKPKEEDEKKDPPPPPPSEEPKDNEGVKKDPNVDEELDEIINEINGEEKSD
jgi:parallel beta-helix repeat protein